MAAAIEPSAGALAEASDHWAIVAGALLADREAFVARLSGAPPTGTSDAQSSIPSFDQCVGFFDELQQRFNALRVL